MMEHPIDQATEQINPFGNIGLAFSGGGFRAAAFSLGTLSYLNRLRLSDQPLTGNISFISSASGGSITNLLYTSGLHNGQSFPDFYRETLGMLTGDHLLEQVLITLNEDSQWGQPGEEKRRNLINSFARVYDRLLFKGQTMDTFWNKKHVPQFEVCVNATEFYRGLSFRFQTDGTANRHQLIGNNYLWFDVKKLAAFQKIKLADVLAASSCFPMGFEPIVYPEDYAYDHGGAQSLGTDELREAMQYENYNEAHFPLSYLPDPAIAEDPKQKSHIRSFGLMDGGITDNQSLKSLMLADKKRRGRAKPDPFDLMIVTDVASYFMDNYEVPPPVEAAGWRQQTIDHYVRLFRSAVTGTGRAQTLLLLAGLLLAATGSYFHPLGVRLPSLILSGAAFGLFAVIFILRRSGPGREAVKQAKIFDIKEFIGSLQPVKRSFSAGIVTKLANYLRLTRLNVFEQMLKARISSVMTMVSDVNLKQVRRLIYEMFYNDHCWDNRRVPNFIYELSTHNIASRQNRLNSAGRLGWKATDGDKQLLLAGMEKINSTAEAARLMATTLWFDENDTANDHLKKVVATGQFTICSNLLEYVISLERKKVKFDKPAQDRLQAIRQQLEADLLEFKADPYFIY